MEGQSEDEGGSDGACLTSAQRKAEAGERFSAWENQTERVISPRKTALPPREMDKYYRNSRTNRAQVTDPYDSASRDYPVGISLVPYFA